MFRNFATFALLTILVGCATHNVQRYGAIDSAEKTVTVPIGSVGLIGKLKRVLASDGWKLVVYRGPSVTEGNIGEKTRIEQYNTFNSRYRLMASYNQYDLCLNFTPAITYDVSFIDNKSGAEIFTINGKGCESGVVETFTNALSGREK